MELGDVFTFAVGSPATDVEIAAALTRHSIDGATIVPALGVWKGQVENSNLVHIAGLTLLQARNVASMLAHEFGQEAVYLEHHGRASLVYGRRDA